MSVMEYYRKQYALENKDVEENGDNAAAKGASQ